MAHFITLTTANRTDGQKVVVNLDLVQMMQPYGSANRLFFGGADDYIDVTESAAEVAVLAVK